MQDYLKTVQLRLDSKRAAMSQPELVNYGRQMSLVRDGAKMSGVESWGRNETIAALFMASSLKGCFRELKRMGLINGKGLEMLEHAVEEQEFIAVQLEP
jgi:hypothetical protein